MATETRLARAGLPVRKTTLARQDEDEELDDTTPAERIGMMWQLALDAWAFMGKPVAEPGLPRHTLRVRRRRSRRRG